MKNLRILIVHRHHAVLAAAVGTARADEVILKNGDRLSGNIVKMGEGSAGIENLLTPERSKIDWKEVQGFYFCGSYQGADAGRVNYYRCRDIADHRTDIVITGDQFGPTIAIPLTSIQMINPPPMVRYSGAFNLGGVVAKGNSDSKAINASLLYSLRADRHRFGVEGKYNYGEQSQKD